MKNYTEAKQRIYLNCRYAVFNAEDALTFPTHSPSIGSSSFTTEHPAPLQFGLDHSHATSALAWGNQILFSTAELPLAGRHNHTNYLAAIALALAAGIPLDQILIGIKSYQSLAHRCEWVDTINHISWFNDSKGTNVGATLAALRGLGQTISGKIIWLAGGQGKGQDFSPLAPACKQFVRHAVLFGEDADKINRALTTFCDMQIVTDLKTAIQKAAQCAQPGDIVLLSPACASFDMFKNFEDRGNQFKQLIKECLV